MLFRSQDLEIQADETDAQSAQITTMDQVEQITFQSLEPTLLYGDCPELQSQLGG